MVEPTRACILCRGVKVVCVNNADYRNSCQRCARMNLPCAYSRKRRNLKALAQASSAVPQPATADVVVAPPLTGSSSPPQLPTPASYASTAVPSVASIPSLAARYVASLRTSLEAPTATISQQPAQTQLASDAILSAWNRPPKRARLASPSGPFLSSGMSNAPISTSAFRAVAQTDVCRHLDPGDDDLSLPDTWNTSPQSHGLESQDGASDDPVSAGCITNEEARRLVYLFHKNLTTQLNLFDPDLHTYEYVRGSSTVLFSAVLAASAKFFRKDSYPMFLGRAQRLLSASLEVGACHIGILQAALILVYYKQPTDQSAWMKIGIAIRQGYQLGLHTQSKDMAPSVDRERLNRERTWFCLTAFDKTYAPLFGLPATIRSYEVADCENWARSHAELACGTRDLGLACSLDHLPYTDTGCLPDPGHSIDRSLTLMKLEQRYNQALAVTNKWFSQPRGQNGVGAEKDAALRMVIFSATLAIRVYMLNYVQQHEIGPILDECLELAVMFLGELRIISHTLRFIQDALSVRLAVFGSSMQSLYWRFSNPQRRLAISLLSEVYDICRTASDEETDVPTAFIARFYEKLLRSLNTASVAMSRQPSPSPPEMRLDDPTADLTTKSIITADLDLPVLNPVDENVLSDLSSFLDNELLNATPGFSAFDEAYWTSLATTLPFNWEDYLVQ